MSEAMFYVLGMCFVIGMVPLMLTFLNPKASRTKWVWTGIWVAIWWFPPLSRLYMYALGG